ncbi:MAG: aminotransferase class V-fold PLP-dependent enzyme [Bacteroidota bacterium]|nr:aminotransferase class V-fold PLP-dependent enzyme [Bacteroidota bacterium]
MQNYFKPFREGIIGLNQQIETPTAGKKRIIYADWIAGGRNYLPIEHRLQNEIMPFVANTHTETSDTGKAMTYAYHKSKQIIKKHVNASEKDVLITCGSGMTRVINKLQRILGLRVHESFLNRINLSESEKPVVFITHMEHHSNQTSWLETLAEVVVVEPSPEGCVSLENFEKTVAKYQNRKTKIAAITSASNVTGLITPYHKVAALMHQAGGYCFVDFACSAPYVDINMHPENPEEYLDAIYFSPHKFLGGPGSTGILIFNQELYHIEIPDNPGGGTVDWTNPWGEHKYVEDIEAREDGGTPAFLQTMKTAMVIQLKETMGVKNILKREEEQVELIWDKLADIPRLHILAGNHKKRLGVISFYIENLHHNEIVKLLNDKFGIQMRGGCSCAGTYGHYLLNVAPDVSQRITEKINQHDYSEKPGWVRFSMHPTMTNEELLYIVDSIRELTEKYPEWIKDYNHEKSTSTIEYCKSNEVDFIYNTIDTIFEGSLIKSTNNKMQ